MILRHRAEELFSHLQYFYSQGAYIQSNVDVDEITELYETFLDLSDPHKDDYDDYDEDEDEEGNVPS
jgi:hypothetical protein